jgi:hypothetical protein
LQDVPVGLFKFSTDLLVESVLSLGITGVDAAVDATLKRTLPR